MAASQTPNLAQAAELTEPSRKVFSTREAEGTQGQAGTAKLPGPGRCVCRANACRHVVAASALVPKPARPPQ